MRPLTRFLGSPTLWTRTSRITALAIALGLAAAGAAAAATPLSLAISHSARLRLAGPASSVVVGSPSVVDVSVVDSRTVFVSGRTQGSTDVTVIDPLGRVVYSGDIVVAGGERQVVVFRGVARSELSCSPSCAEGEGAAATAPAVPGGGGLAAAAAAPLTGPINAALQGAGPSLSGVASAPR